MQDFTKINCPLIKKEVQYEYYDFSLNEPYTKDFRPIRFNSAFSDWKQIKKRETAIMRHFEVNSIPKEQIIQEQQISDNEIYNYSSYLNIMHEIMMRLKQNNRKLSQAEKSYIFDYNRGKLNLGCENIMKKYLNLLEFLAIEDQILRLHGYQVLQRPKVFSQFYLLMNKKLCSFFQKLQTILMYKPLLVGKEGQLSLFSTMERSKLSYLILKEKFHLHKIQSSFGAKVFIPHNSFQKFGAVVDDVKTGGLDGKNLADAWLPFSLYLDIDTIRSYAGQQLAYIVMYQQYLIIFLLLVVIPFLTIFAIETVFGAPIFPITTQFQIIFMGITYQIYLQSWIRAQEKFINDYTEGVKSKAFLNHFSGPFVRNPVSDQANQFVEDAGLLIWIRRLISLIIIFAILVAFGAIFHGCKMVLLEIHEDLKGYFISDLPYISLPYLLAYFIFFLVETLSKYLLTARFIFKWLTLLNNPCSDEEQQRLMDKFKFMYSIGIELIGPVLLIIIYPSQRTSCYSSSCIDEIIYYCYSRFIFLICVLLIQLLYMVGYFLKGKVTKAKQQMKVNKFRFEQRLKKMLKIALQSQQLPEYKEDTIDALVPLFLIIMFVNTLSQSSLIVLTSILIMFIRLRLKIFYKVKRTLNKSNTIINISSKLRIIYYIGLSVNCWTNVQTFQNLRQYLQPFILLLQSRATLSEQVLQLIELFAILINFFAIILLAALCQITFQAFDNNFLQTRKNNKVKNYRFKIQKTKLMPLVTNETPLKTVFRTFPPDLQLQRKFNQRLQTLNLTQQKLQSYKLASAQVINVPANSGL